MQFFIIFFILVIGLGIFLKKISEITRTSEKVLVLLLYPCIFLLGILFGLDDKIVNSIEIIGWNKFFYLIAELALGIILIWSVYKISAYFFSK